MKTNYLKHVLFLLITLQHSFAEENIISEEDLPHDSLEAEENVLNIQDDFLYEDYEVITQKETVYVTLEPTTVFFTLTETTTLLANKTFQETIPVLTTLDSVSSPVKTIIEEIYNFVTVVETETVIETTILATETKIITTTLVDEEKVSPTSVMPTSTTSFIPIIPTSHAFKSYDGFKNTSSYGSNKGYFYSNLNLNKTEEINNKNSSKISYNYNNKTDVEESLRTFNGYTGLPVANSSFENGANGGKNEYSHIILISTFFSFVLTLLSTVV
jgi:hypothetical protein